MRSAHLHSTTHNECTALLKISPPPCDDGLISPGSSAQYYLAWVMHRTEYLGVFVLETGLTVLYKAAAVCLLLHMHKATRLSFPSRSFTPPGKQEDLGGRLLTLHRLHSLGVDDRGTSIPLFKQTTPSVSLLRPILASGFLGEIRKPCQLLLYRNPHRYVTLVVAELLVTTSIEICIFDTHNLQ